MKRIEKVWQHLLKYNKETPLSASQLSQELAITRANASNDLNLLVKEGKAKKTGTKPVFFYPISDDSEKKSLIQEFIKKNPSLVSAVEQAKAAIFYPPQRMHILLSGDTGVGKSMFAELVYRFSIEEQIISNDARFILFNCADYANNPQLITGNIFGTKKGAYTGADEEKQGLLEKADGGILFLDEIHRLPPEAQEMLFTFIDKGFFRRLGETSEQRQADVQIICATTENIESTLLQTFVRRIPMKIHLPNLMERGIFEKLTLITTFFNEEAHKLAQGVVVSMNTLRALLGYPCENNIGQLKSDIQLLCARSYARFVSEKSQSMSISSYDLPNAIKEGLYNVEYRSEIWSLIPSRKDRFILFKKDDFTTIPVDEYKETDIYQLIDQKLNDMEKIGLNQKAAMDIIDLTIRNYFSTLRKKRNVNEENILNIVGTEVYATTKKLLKKAANIVQSEFYPEVFSGLALHLFSTVNRIRNGEIIHNPRLEEIKEQYPLYYQAAQQCKYLIETAFSLSISDDEVGFITLFLTPQEHGNTNSQTQNVQVIVIAHGDSTATSISSVVNELLGNEHVVGFNMPLSYEPQHILEEISAYLQQKETQEDILLLVDMGSLTNFPKELEKVTGKKVACIDLVSTLHVLEASRKASLGFSLSDIVDSVHTITHTERTINTPVKNNTNIQDKVFIITSCTTGEGSAQIIKDLLTAKLALHDGRCEIKSFQVNNPDEFLYELEKLEAGGKILYSISTFSIPALQYPQLTINQLLSDGMFAKIQKTIDYELTFFGMLENIAPMLVQLDGIDLLYSLKNWVENISLEMKLNLSAERMIGLICHLACCIDTIIQTNQSNEFHHQLEDFPPSVDKKLANNIILLEKMYNIMFSSKELHYIESYLFEKIRFK